MLTIDPIPAFDDNYIWCLRRDTSAWVVDPGDAAPVLAFLTAHGLRLAGILITHHHGDHTGGLQHLRDAWPEATVVGPINPGIAGIDQRLAEDDAVTVLGCRFTVIAVPGHTLDHIAYFCADADVEGGPRPLLFCGDTLFAAGCGRLFEGSAGQMFDSLGKLAALPAATAVYCAHEYTLSNLRFASAVEPANPDVAQRLQETAALRARGEASVPSTLALEQATNPFLRCREPAVQTAAREHAEAADPVAVFAVLRAWKDRF